MSLELGRGDELETAWRAAAARLGFDPDDGTTRFFVTYNGPEDEWLWTARFERVGSDPPFALEGWGPTPSAAIKSLLKAVDHDVGYWPIKRPWDEKSRRWAEEEGLG